MDDLIVMLPAVAMLVWMAVAIYAFERWAKAFIKAHS